MKKFFVTLMVVIMVVMGLFAQMRNAEAETEEDMVVLNRQDLPAKLITLDDLMGESGRLHRYAYVESTWAYNKSSETYIWSCEFYDMELNEYWRGMETIRIEDVDELIRKVTYWTVYDQFN